MAFFDLPLDQLKTYIPPAPNPRTSTLSGNPPSMKHGHSPRCKVRKSGLRTRRTGNLRCHLQRLRRTTHQRLVHPSKSDALANYLVLLNSSATAADVNFPLTGSSGQAQATPTSSWIPADKAAHGQQAIRLISMLMAAIAQFPGSMTKGILDPKHYFYRRVFTDAVRAIETARSHDAVDATQIAVTGGSQGGGITIAAAGLVPDVAVAMPDVPFLCHYRRATEI